MRILFHAINGVGLGHVVRLAWIEEAIRNSCPEVECLIVSTSKFAEQYFSGVCQQVSCDLRHPVEHEEQVLRHLEEFRPDVTVFDTRWPNGVVEFLATRGLRRILILRAFSPDRMLRFARQAQDLFERVILPHSRQELVYYYSSDPLILDILSRHPFVAVGPLARVEKYSPEASGINFSLGAGGDYLLGANAEDNVQRQLENYISAAELLHTRGYRELRLLAGPMLSLPDDLGHLVVVRSFRTNTLLGPGTCIVSRGGYNTCWEALGVGSHLVLASSQVVVEDVLARCRYLEERGMARLTDGTPQEVADAVLCGPPPGVGEGRKIVNAGLNEVVNIILTG